MEKSTTRRSSPRRSGSSSKSRQRFSSPASSPPYEENAIDLMQTHSLLSNVRRITTQGRKGTGYMELQELSPDAEFGNADRSIAMTSLNSKGRALSATSSDAEDKDELEDWETPLSPGQGHLPHGTSTLTQAVLNFTNSIVGAGIIGLPFALRQSGFWMGLILLVALTFVIDWTIRLLVKSSKMAGRGTYQDLVFFCFGKRGLISISLFQFLFAFGGMCAYIIIVGDTLPIVLRQFFNVTADSSLLWMLTSRRSIIVLTTVFISLPLSLFRDISKLSKTSALALLALVFILAALIIEGPYVKSELRDGHLTLDFIRPEFLQAVGVISFAFVCHHNSFLIYASLHEPTLDRWAIVTHFSTGLSFVFSALMAIFGYLTFGDKTHGNILNNFSDGNVVMNIARICFAFNMFTTYPLECFVCREVIENYYFPEQKISDRKHVLITAGLVGVSLMITLVTCNLGTVLELTGCFSATALAFILPPACYLKLASGRMWSWKKMPSLVCLVLGVLVMFISTFMTLQQAWFGEGDKKDCRW